MQLSLQAGIELGEMAEAFQDEVVQATTTTTTTIAMHNKNPTTFG